ncbi:MAG TPA: alpha/beta hydrolase [Actinomycetota bacterium]|nr:alpha/beta hydrolase [Actinomycetota bacterium]
MTADLLLLHAFPLDARMWEDLAGPPGVVAPDLPGFGNAPSTTGGVLTMADAATAALDALEAAGGERAVVCGLSMGGYVAFELWRRAPERVAGLILANTRAEPDTDEARGARTALAERLRTEGNVLVEEPPPLLADDAPPELVDRVRRWIASQDPEAIAAAALGLAERPDSRPDLPRIDVPTLVITSDRDRLIPAAVSAPMADAIPGAELAVIEGAGHLSNVERPARFAELVQRFREGVG